jgi:hypothetical protein
VSGRDLTEACTQRLRGSCGVVGGQRSLAQQQVASLVVGFLAHGDQVGLMAGWLSWDRGMYSGAAVKGRRRGAAARRPEGYARERAIVLLRELRVAAARRGLMPAAGSGAAQRRARVESRHVENVAEACAQCACWPLSMRCFWGFRLGSQRAGRSGAAREVGLARSAAATTAAAAGQPLERLGWRGACWASMRGDCGNAVARVAQCEGVVRAVPGARHAVRGRAVGWTSMGGVAAAQRLRMAAAAQACVAWQRLRMAATAHGSSCAWQRLRMAAAAHGSDCAWQRLRMAATAHGSDCAWQQLRMASTAHGSGCAWQRLRMAAHGLCGLWPVMAWCWA